MPREAIEDLTTYATKEPTDLQARFAEWIPEQTGFDPNSCKNKLEAFNAGVRLATAMRMIFQASPENKAANAARKAGTAAPEEAPAAPAKKATKAAKAAKAAAPAKTAPPAKAAKSAPPAKRTRRAAAAAPAATEDEAPF